MFSFAATQVWSQGIPNAGTCDVAAVTQYVVENLDTACAASLSFALYANIASPGKDTALNTICTADCAGKLANWLQNECDGTFNATSLYYLCLQTGGRATVGRYCQYSIPPAFDADQEILTVFQACENTLQQLCTDQCEMQLRSFAGQLGCCYQSLYNNTDFVRGAAAIGELATQDVMELQTLGNPALWSACGVTPPGRCTIESFDFPTDGSVKLLPCLSVLATLVLLVAAITGFA